jgi:hypothetical protein
VDNGKTGFVANTPRTYADAVAYLINNREEAKQMGVSGFEKMKKEYDAKKITKMLEKTYLELLVKKCISANNTKSFSYENINIFPTNSDILNYPIEYQQRLITYFGNTYSMDKLKFKLECLYRHTVSTNQRANCFARGIGCRQ